MKDSKKSRAATLEATMSPFPVEEGSSFGDIKINHSVIASIVRIAALEVPGVHSIGGSLVEGIAELFS